MPVFYVYILRSQKSGKLYTGQTNNLDRRLVEHNDPLHNVGSIRLDTKVHGF